jgi:hypothetical protein
VLLAVLHCAVLRRNDAVRDCLLDPAQRERAREREREEKGEFFLMMTKKKKKKKRFLLRNHSPLLPHASFATAQHTRAHCSFEYAPRNLTRAQSNEKKATKKNDDEKKKKKKCFCRPRCALRIMLCTRNTDRPHREIEKRERD